MAARGYDSKNMNVIVLTML